MAELNAEGPGAGQRWQRKLSVATPVVLGRNEPDWSAPWERWLSRRHVEMVFDHDRLQVKKLPAAHNPVFFHGRDDDDFQMRGGDCFVIGETVFTLVANHESSSSSSRKLAQAYSIGADQLRSIPFRDAPHRIDVLGHLSNVISGLTDRNGALCPNGQSVARGYPPRRRHRRR